MNKKIKCPVGKLGNTKKHKHYYDNSASTQRARILEHFSKSPRLTTMQARNVLGILHPCGRIMELRRLGYKIDTVRVHAEDSNGVNHRIGMYIFHGLDWAIFEKRLLITHGLSSLTLDQRYELLKADIASRHLTPKQYERAIKSLTKFLNC